MTGRTGRFGEDIAARFLVERGYRIVARNWRAGRTGELDIVAKTGGILVVVEVKTAAHARFGDPLTWVTPRKIRQLARLADAFLARYDEAVEAVRFDVISVRTERRPPEVTHLADAFRP